MQVQALRPAVNGKGWMSFTIATGAVLHLGGASVTTPTSQLSPSNFLAAGIPQNGAKTRFADSSKDEPSGHIVKRVIVNIISALTPGTPNARYAYDGSTPTATLGAARAAGDMIDVVGNAAIFNFKLINNGGGNMVVEVEVEE